MHYSLGISKREEHQITTTLTTIAQTIETQVNDPEIDTNECLYWIQTWLTDAGLPIPADNDPITTWTQDDVDAIIQDCLAE